MHTTKIEFVNFSPIGSSTQPPKIISPLTTSFIGGALSSSIEVTTTKKLPFLYTYVAIITKSLSYTIATPLNL